MRSLRSVLCPFVFVIALFTALPVWGQNPGQNVNMVSGTKWPGGDPFLQRQNEPSLAVSTRNPIHLLAGANDYRSVDIPNPNSPDERGDAWLGVFKSFDGGATWGSTLLPGYPQDTSAAGMASPLHGFTTAADPVVRAGTNGLLYYSGIAFNRGTNQGQIFVSRFMDLNNQEGGDASQSLDPIRYISTTTIDTGTSGQFLDKPWIAVDIPRGTATCTIQVPQGTTTVQQTVPAGNIYVVWSRFTGSQSTKLMFSRSQDCGVTWSNPIKLSSGNLINQGTTMAVDPKTGNIYVAWRRFVSSSAPDAIVSVASTNFGQSFSNPVDILDLPVYSSTTPNAPSFFDQDTTSAEFRIHAFPTIGVDGNGVAYVAWSQRGLPPPPGGNAQDARIAMATSTNGVSWGAPFAIDNGPLTENGQPILDSSGNQLVRGHQVMPQITVNAGQLFVLYYDLREDHTTSLFPPNTKDASGNICAFCPDANGNFFQEKRQLQGELAIPGNASQVFTPFLTDANLTIRRHTLDLVVAQADTNKSPLAFTTSRVSRYKFGLRNDGKDVIGPDGFPILQQLQTDPPNLPLFEQGQVPFMGDYVDIAGVNFVPTDASGQHWTFNTSPGNNPVVYATWTSNQDVIPPADGDWTHYTPVGGGGPSIYSSGTTSPACSTGQQGMRNQNIYVSRITQGLVLASPQNYKPLNTTFQRGFGIFVENFTNFDKSFQLSVANQPAGGWASFVPAQGNPLPPAGSFVPTTTLTVTVPAHSGIGRMVFATSTTPASSIQVNAAEMVSGGTTLKAGGLSSFVILNPDPTAPALLNPPGNTAADISSAELFNGSLVNVGVTDPNIDGSLVNGSYFYGSLVNGSLVNADVSSGSLVNGSLVNGSLVNGSLVNGSLVNGSLVNGSLVNGSLVNTDLATFGVASGSLLNTTLANGSLVNGSLVNGSLVNGSLVNGSLVNAPVSDLSYTFTHNGNTAGTYTIGLIGNPNSPPNLQLIVTKTYFTTTSVGCTLAQEPHNVVLSNVNNPTLLPVTTNPSDPAITDTGAGRSTIVLGPGETAIITLRGVNLSPTSLHGLTTQMGPLVTSHACNTSDPQCGTRFFAAPLLITTGTLLSGTVGAPYNAILTNIGGVAPFSWTITLGTLPPGLTLSSAGLLSGTPTTAGTFSFTASLLDSSSPQNSTTRALTLNLAQGATTNGISTSSASLVFGQQVILTATVGTGPVFPSGTVTFTDGVTTLGTGTLGNGIATLATSALALGSHNVSASYSGDPNFLPSNSSPLTLNVGKASTATALSTSPASAVFGQPLTLTANVSTVSPGAGTPTGTITFTDGSNTLGTANLSGGTASFTTSTLSTGSHSFNAAYGGDTNFAGSSPATALTQTINPAVTSASLASSPNPSVFGQTVTFSTTVSVVAPGVGTPTGNVTFKDGTTTLGTVALTAGAASFTTASLAAGSHSITVSYSGDGSFAAITSTAVLQTVNPAATATLLASSSNPSVFGQTVTFSTTVSVVAPGLGIPSGIVTFRDGATALGTAPLTAGTASFTTSSLAVGNHSITASYPNNGNFAASISAALTQTANKASTTTTISSITPNPVGIGKPVTVSFSVGVVAPGIGAPTGTVTVSDGAGAACTATLPTTSCTLTSTTTGSHTLKATYSGDGNFAGSSGTSSVQETVTYVFTGFFSPLVAAGTFSAPSFTGTANLGNAVPIKWSLQNASGNYISNLNTTTLLEAIPNPSCSGPPTGSAIVLYSPTSGAKGGSTFKFSTNQFVLNWDTSTGVTAGCFTIVLQLNDGSPLKATTIQLK